LKREYDAIFVIDSDKNEKEIEEFKNKIQGIFKKYKAEPGGPPDVERKELYHPIKKKNSVLFLRYKLTCEPQSIEDIKKAIKHEEEILRYAFWRKED